MTGMSYSRFSPRRQVFAAIAATRRRPLQT